MNLLLVIVYGSKIHAIIVVMKNPITTLYLYLLDADPGLIKFKQGLKSVMALLLIILCIINWVPMIGLVFACLTGVFVGLNHYGGTLKAQKLHMLFSVWYFPLVIGLGLGLQPYFWLANSVLIILSFLGFYLVKFGSRYRTYPAMAAVFYLLSINFSVPSMEDKLLIFVAVLLAGLISYGVYFYLWPEQPKAELEANIDSLLVRYIHLAKGLFYLVDGINKQENFKLVRESLIELEQSLQKAFQVVDRAAMGPDKSIAEALLVKLYALYVLLFMMSGWLQELHTEVKEEGLDYQSSLSKLMGFLLDAFTRLSLVNKGGYNGQVMDEEFNVVTERFKISVFGTGSIPNANLINYSYIAFGFNRLIILLELIRGLLNELKLSS